jgi:1-deoxy-D-xylulose-5-phosphate synthase
MAPKDEHELRQMLLTALEYPGPAAVRFPRGAAAGGPIEEGIKPLKIGEAELLRDGSDIALVAIGSMVPPALEAAELLHGAGIRAAVLNARFAKPIDAERIAELGRRCGALVTIEEHSRMGGFGDAVLSALSEADVQARTRVLGVPDQVVEHGSPKEMLASFGLDAPGIERAARALLGR